MQIAVLFALFAAASAGNLYGPGIGLGLGVGVAHGVGIYGTGHSVRQQSQNVLGQYNFGYNEQHATGGSTRQESGAPGVKVGSYSLNVGDGRRRVVNYVADALGFRANVQTNEPGTVPSIPAHAPTNVGIAAAPIAAVATAPIAAVAAAPIGLGYGGFGYGGLGYGAGLGYGLGYGYGAGVYGAGYGLGLARPW